MKKGLAIISLVISLLSIGLVSIFYLNQRQVVVVRLDKVLDAYQGTQEEFTAYQVKIKDWEKEVDSMTIGYQRSLDLYNQQVKDLSEEDKGNREQLLNTQYTNLQSISTQLERRAYQEKQEIQGRAMAQVRKFLTKYANDKKYDVVIGGFEGNTVVLHTSSTVDITEVFIAELNTHYLEGE
jgi:Skp family chaperone for outer membrane proteins